MEGMFVLKIIISFVVGGVWIVTATVLADRLGTKIGGFIVGLPSTVLLGLLFIGWTQNPKVAVQATTVVPLVGGISTLFMVGYVYQLRKGIVRALSTALLLWMALSFFLVISQFNNFQASLLGFILMFLFSFLIFEYKFKIQSISGNKIQYTPLQIIFRGLLSGLVVMVAVVLGKLGGPLLGGMASTFPAMFLSTLLITYLTQGPEFSAAVAKSAMTGSASVVVYAVAVRYTYLPYGLIGGTLISMVVALLSGYIIFQIIIKKLL